MNEAIKNLIIQMLTEGKTSDDVKSALRQRGYSESDIEKFVAEFNSSMPDNPQSESQKSGSSVFIKTLIVIISIIIMGGGGVFAYTTLVNPFLLKDNTDIMLMSVANTIEFVSQGNKEIGLDYNIKIENRELGGLEIDLPMTIVTSGDLEDPVNSDIQFKIENIKFNLNLPDAAARMMMLPVTADVINDFISGIDVEVRKIDDMLYFKVDNLDTDFLSQLFGAPDLSPVTGRWIDFELTDLESAIQMSTSQGIGDELLRDKHYVSDIKYITDRMIQAVFEDSEPSIVREFKEGKMTLKYSLDGEKVFQAIINAYDDIAANVQSEEMKNFDWTSNKEMFDTQIQQDDLTSLLNVLNVDLLINKDFIIEEAESALAGEMNDPSSLVSIDYTAKSKIAIGQTDVSIEAPSDSTPFEQIIMMLNGPVIYGQPDPFMNINNLLSFPENI